MIRLRLFVLRWNAAVVACPPPQGHLEVTCPLPLTWLTQSRWCPLPLCTVSTSFLCRQQAICGGVVLRTCKYSVPHHRFPTDSAPTDDPCLTQSLPRCAQPGFPASEFIPSASQCQHPMGRVHLCLLHEGVHLFTYYRFGLMSFYVFQ